MAKKQWVYRPTDQEHEKLLRAMERSPEYTSIAQFVREATLRLVHENDRRKLFSEMDDLIEELRDVKEKFIHLVLKHSEEG